MTPALFENPSLTLFAYDPVSILFTDFQVSIDCLGKSQELIYSEGPLLGTGLVLSDFLQIASDPAPTKSKIEGNLNDEKWIATHKLIIKGTNGQLNNAPDARGNKGIFGTANSQPLTLIVEHPCRNAKIDNFVINSMEATVLGPAIRQDIGSKLPQDDVSRVQGNKDGFTYCGERKFRITSTG